MTLDPGTVEYEVVFALRHKSPIRLKRDVEFEAVARAVVQQLKLSGWVITKREPAPEHRSPPGAHES